MFALQETRTFNESDVNYSVGIAKSLGTDAEKAAYGGIRDLATSTSVVDPDALIRAYTEIEAVHEKESKVDPEEVTNLLRMNLYQQRQYLAYKYAFFCLWCLKPILLCLALLDPITLPLPLPAVASTLPPTGIPCSAWVCLSPPSSRWSGGRKNTIDQCRRVTRYVSSFTLRYTHLFLLFCCCCCCWFYLLDYYYF